MAPKPELVAVLSMVLYSLAGFAVWWKTTEISRPALPLQEMQSMQQDPLLYISARRRPSLTFYLVTEEDVSETQDIARDWVERMHVLLAKSMDVPRHEADQQLVVHGADACKQFRSQAAATSHTRQPITCLPLPAPEELRRQAPQQLDATLQHALATAGGSWSQPGRTVVFLLPDASLHGDGTTPQLVLGQHRHGWLRYPTGGRGQPALQVVAHNVDSLTAALMLNDGGSAARRLPISGAGQVQLAFTLCNANSTSQPLSWEFDDLELGYLQAVAHALEPVARVSISSEVLHYAPAAVQPTWSEAHAAYVVANAQLPFFVDSRWNLHTGSTSFGSTGGLPPSGAPASAAGGGQCPAGSPQDCVPAQAPPPQPADAAAGSGGAAVPQAPGHGAARSGGAAGQQEVGSHIPPHVLHFVVYIPPPDHRPLRVLLRNGSVSPTNSFWIPSWGGVIVLNPAADPAPPAHGLHPRVQQLASSELYHVAKVAVAQLHAQLGIPAHKPLLPSSPGDDRGGCGDSSSSRCSTAEPGLQSWPVARWQVVHLPAPSGLAGWQVDALLRRATAANLAGAASKLGNLSALVQELPNLEMPQLIGDQVAAALQELRAAMRQAAAGAHHAAAAAARAARTHAEAAFFHPAVLAQFNFPDSHKLGIYMPFFLPVGAAILRSVVREVALARGRRRAR